MAVRVRGASSQLPRLKDARTTRASRGERAATADATRAWARASSMSASGWVAGAGTRSARVRPMAGSPTLRQLPAGASRLMLRSDARRADWTSATERRRRAATCSSVAGVQVAPSYRARSALAMAARRSHSHAGSRTVRAWLAMYRPTRCRHHHEAGVEKRKPRSGSKRRTASMRPTHASWMRSSTGTPDLTRAWACFIANPMLCFTMRSSRRRRVAAEDSTL